MTYCRRYAFQTSLSLSESEFTKSKNYQNENIALELSTNFLIKAGINNVHHLSDI